MAEIITALNGLTWPGSVALSALSFSVAFIVWSWIGWMKS